MTKKNKNKKCEKEGHTSGNYSSGVCMDCAREQARKYLFENSEEVNKRRRQRYKEDEEYRQIVKDRVNKRRLEQLEIVLDEERKAAKKKQITHWLVKEVLIEDMGGKCNICNGVFPPECYDFHHIDESTKSFNIASSRLSYKNLDIVKDELRKCMLVCANCHRSIHMNNFANED